MAFFSIASICCCPCEHYSTIEITILLLLFSINLVQTYFLAFVLLFLIFALALTTNDHIPYIVSLLSCFLVWNFYLYMYSTLSSTFFSSVFVRYFASIYIWKERKRNYVQEIDFSLSLFVMLNINASCRFKMIVQFGYVFLLIACVSVCCGQDEKPKTHVGECDMKRSNRILCVFVI